METTVVFICRSLPLQIGGLCLISLHPESAFLRVGFLVFRFFPTPKLLRSLFFKTITLLDPETSSHKPFALDSKIQDFR